jgi:hypothetical protein
MINMPSIYVLSTQRLRLNRLLANANAFNHFLLNNHFLLKLWICAMALSGWQNAIAKEFDDKGKLGGVIAVGGGATTGFGSDENGKSTSSFIGSAFQFHFGEEVWQRLHLGLSFDMNQGKTQDSKYNQSLFAFGAEARWRLNEAYQGLFFLGGMGIGAGGFETIKIKDKDDFPGGLSGGSIWKLGIGYVIPLYDQESKWLLSPKLVYQQLMAQSGAKTTIDSFALSVEILWGAGRKDPVQEAKGSVQRISQ